VVGFCMMELETQLRCEARTGGKRQWQGLAAAAVHYASDNVRAAINLPSSSFPATSVRSSVPSVTLAEVGVVRWDECVTWVPFSFGFLSSHPSYSEWFS
jgi:hypothetical protein